MSYRNKEILRDKNNRPIPQIWSEEIDDFVPYTGNTEEIKAIKNDLVTIKNELQAIKANQLSGDAKVTLSGTIVERVVAIPRSVRTEDTEVNAYTVRVPNGAKGFVATLEIWGATGTFDTNQGAALYCYARGQVSSANRSLGLDINTQRSTSRHQCPVIMMYPGINHVPEGRYVQISRVAFGQYMFQIQINGTFEPGQGIDCAVIIEWLL